MSQSDRVGNRIFNFRKTENLTEKNSEVKHRVDAAEQQRTRGARNANSLRLKDYGFFTSVAV